MLRERAEFLSGRPRREWDGAPNLKSDPAQPLPPRCFVSRAFRICRTKVLFDVEVSEAESGIDGRGTSL